MIDTIIHNQGSDLEWHEYQCRECALTYRTEWEAEACDHQEPKPKGEFTKDELNVLTVIERGLSRGDIFVPMQLWPAGVSRCEVAHALRTLCQKVAHSVTAGLEKQQ